MEEVLLTDAAMDECWRVLKLGGRVCLEASVHASPLVDALQRCASSQDAALPVPPALNVLSIGADPAPSVSTRTMALRRGFICEELKLQGYLIRYVNQGHW